MPENIASSQRRRCTYRYFNHECGVVTSAIGIDSDGYRLDGGELALIAKMSAMDEWSGRDCSLYEYAPAI